MKRSVLMKLTACCMTGAMVLGSTGVVTMASGLDSALAGQSAAEGSCEGGSERL